jgi:hypothetical protein
MSDNNAARPKKQSSLDEMLEQAKNTAARRQTSAQTTQKDAPVSSQFADIQSNPFYKIVLNPESTPTQKKAEVAQALSYAKDADKAKERLEAFNQFKEFLQHERKRMAQEIIALTDTGAFAELKSVYDEINDALLTFEAKITPLTDIVDAVYTLRMNGVTFDVFREIAKDKQAEEELRKLRAAQEAELAQLTGSVSTLRDEIARLGEDKGWFGMGGVRKTSREQMAVLTLQLQDRQAEMTQLAERIAQTPDALKPESGLVEYAEQKSRLRELLDISSDDHVKRQKDLVEAAQSFIQTTEARVGRVSEHFGNMDQQIGNLSEANYSMREVYAIINDATKQAEGDNETFRQTLQPVGDTEGDIERMARERTKRDLENHIKSLGTSAVDTTTVLAELTGSSHRIKSMQDANEQQITKTRQLHSSGVAGVADQLSTVLQAVSSAALGESSEMARMSLERMQKTTSELGQKEVIRVALGTQELNSELNKALQDLEQYGQVIDTATTITRQGLTETRELLGKLESTAREVQESVKESISVAADVTAGRTSGDDEKGKPPEQAPAKPFGF